MARLVRKGRRKCDCAPFSAHHRLRDLAPNRSIWHANSADSRVKGRHCAAADRGRRWPECKWGRHCCRFHSHRRVGCCPVRPCGFPAQRTLGARCFPVALAEPDFPGLHRRSHRHPIQLLVKTGPRAVFAMRQNRGQSIFPPDCRIDALISQGLGARPRCLAGLIGPLRFAFAVSSSGPFASGRSPLHLVLEVRADSNRSVFRLRITLRYQAVEPSIVATSASFR